MFNSPEISLDAFQHVVASLSLNSSWTYLELPEHKGEFLKLIENIDDEWMMFISIKGILPSSIVEDLFDSNVTLMQCNYGGQELSYYMNLNSLCKEMNASMFLFFLKQLFSNYQHNDYLSDKIHRNSVPRRSDMPKEEMREYLKQLMSEGEQWKAIKMVVLGNGRIGKTTLLHSIHQLLTPSQMVCLFPSTSTSEKEPRLRNNFFWPPQLRWVRFSLGNSFLIPHSSLLNELRRCIYQYIPIKTAIKPTSAIHPPLFWVTLVFWMAPLETYFFSHPSLFLWLWGLAKTKTASLISSTLKNFNFVRWYNPHSYPARFEASKEEI